MLHLEKVNGNSVWDILKLTVSESQKNFVAANEISIIEAYTAITGNGHAWMNWYLNNLMIMRQRNLTD